MVYSPPGIHVQQELTQRTSVALHPLPAMVVGPHATLIRFDEPDERAEGLLGYYDRLLETEYEWPNQPASSRVDEDYTQLFIKDALLQYFDDQVSADSTITKTGRNKVSSDTVNWKSNGDTYPRDALLLDRDVKTGDIVKVRGTPGVGDPITLWASVRGFEADQVDAVTGAASADSDNPSSQSVSTTVTKTDGADNCMRLTADASAYDGLPSGFIVETYTILVTESSVGGDLTTALLRVISASGEDDADDVTPSDAGDPTDIGDRGLAVTFDPTNLSSCSTDADDDNVSQDDLIAGQTWTVLVHDNFTKPVATSSGDYAGDRDTTYVIEVTRGGLYASSTKPQITCTTTNGIDVSGPTTVSTAATNVAVGSQGVLVQFSGTGLRKGDKYYIDATAVTDGPIRTLVLSRNLSEDLDDDTEVSVTLFILVPELEVTKNRVGFAPLTNYATSQTELTVSDGMIAYESSWTDGGDLQPLDVYSESSQSYGKLYVQARYWLSDLCGAVRLISPDEDLDSAISGATHRDNPLKWGVHMARLNASACPVGYVAICDPDDADSWADAIRFLTGRTDAYGITPLTRDATVLGLFEEHVNTMSNEDQNLWRRMWVSLNGMPEIPVVSAANAPDSGGHVVPGHILATTTDGEEALATITDDPDTGGTQYTLLNCTSANGDFDANHVQAGDVVRALFTTDGFGGVLYSEFTISEVVNEDTLLLDSGPDAAVNVAAKFEVWRNLSSPDEAAEIASRAAAYGNRRVLAVWPDQIESDGTLMEGYFLCAALAGRTSGVLPHQGLTRLSVSGFSDVDRTTEKFMRAELDTMAGAGVWIVTKDDQGTIVTRHGVTTGDTDNVNAREEMIGRNLDSICFRIVEALAPFIGVTNVVDSNRARIETELRSLFDVLKSENFTESLGGQIIDATINDVRAHATQADRFVIDLTVVLPAPVNAIDVTVAI